MAAIIALFVVGATFVWFMNLDSDNDNIFGWFLLVALLEMVVLGAIFG